MNADLRFKRGLVLVSHETGVSMRQASMKAGFNENALNRFVNGKHDIKLMTLDTICRKGFGSTFDVVWKAGR